MERFRLLLASIQKYVGQLGATQKMLVGSLAVIAVMALFLWLTDKSLEVLIYDWILRWR